MYLQNRVFIALAGIIFILAASYSFPFLLIVGKIGLICLLILVIIDTVYLWSYRSQLHISRNVLPKLSLGVLKDITYTLHNQGDRQIDVNFIDELPDQFQEREFHQFVTIDAGKEARTQYTIRICKSDSFSG